MNVKTIQLDRFEMSPMGDKCAPWCAFENGHVSHMCDI